MVYVIAECGVNWRNLSDADMMIREAKRAGANSVKFQAYEEIDVADHGRADELNYIRLKPEDIRYLYYRCRAANLDFLCTPMYPEAVEMLEPYVSMWKIRYTDRNNVELIKKCLDTGKTLLISDDTPPDVKDDQIKTLFCVPGYPPKDYPIFDRNNWDGYSCHVPDIVHAIGVVNYHNLKYLEVHVRLNDYGCGYEPIDQRVSISMDELKQLCEALNG